MSAKHQHLRATGWGESTCPSRVSRVINIGCSYEILWGYMVLPTQAVSKNQWKSLKFTKHLANGELSDACSSFPNKFLPMLQRLAKFVAGYSVTCFFMFVVGLNLTWKITLGYTNFTHIHWHAPLPTIVTWVRVGIPVQNTKQPIISSWFLA